LVPDLDCHAHFLTEQTPITVGSYQFLETLGCAMYSMGALQLEQQPSLLFHEIDLTSLHYT